MKALLLNIISLLTICLSIKQVFAIDEFFTKHTNNTRTELFERMDFKVPTLKIHLNDVDYQNLFYRYECEKDSSPNFLKRNDVCYTAPWVNLTYSLERAINKGYININKVTKKSDITLIKNVLENHTHNITIDEFENIVEKYTDFSLEKIMSIPYKLAPIPIYDFNTTDASMTFDLDGEISKFSKVKFSVGGRSTKAYSKLGYNINIKKGGLLYGAKQLRLRADVVDPSFLREKLVYDLCTLVDLPTLSANYVRFYINDTFMGLFLLRDAFKSQWVQNNFGEKNTKHIYTCDKTYGKSEFFNCINDDEDIKDDKDWPRFIELLNNSKSREDLEKFFDVNTYIRWQVSRYLFGSWDHKTSTHNNAVYMFHSEYADRDLWIPLLYDFDMDFGSYRTIDPKVKFSEEVVDKNNPLYTLLNLNDESEEVRAVMDDIMRRGFNPNILLPRIDELKKFIDPYIKEDRTVGENGRFPGRMVRMSDKADDHYQYEDFVANTEFTTLKAKQYSGDVQTGSATVLGLKVWVIERFKFACEAYNLDCSYADEILSRPEYTNYTVDIIRREGHDTGCLGTSYSCCIFDDTLIITSDSTGNWGFEGDRWCLIKNNKECWAKAQGYNCCEKRTTAVTYVDKKTGEEWGYEGGKWCGITDLQHCPDFSDEYACCKGCDVVSVTSNGNSKWGVENKKWCSIPYSCKVY
ncbi:hypothetical protein BCR36DRAFT_410959 [Piromyces finnis]|uniref:CBM10 domain-containing protein n=1 Tax=Piromyces finnis TaxID=1754191 RepID=A0A1Y1VEZ8_9FUNG|nr:hypothetical protein BCR36DRAFT_410959 [Piromyces finnis]|eukprot:ORX53803.1 hypothetical protein BCR36DRAFT_410959 [Piromyces finnis]